MKARVSLSIVALCFSAALAGCGSVTNGTGFKAPNGWTATPSMFGRMQMWIKPDASDRKNTQMVMLVRANAGSGDMFGNSQSFGSRGKLTDVKRSAIKICGNQPAEYLTANGESANGNRSVFEAVQTDVKDSKYLVMYIRPVGQAPDTQAEDAIRSVCATG